MKKIFLIIFCFYSLVVAGSPVGDTSVHKPKANSAVSNQFNDNEPEDTADHSLEKHMRMDVPPLTAKRLLLQEKSDSANNAYFVWNCSYKRSIFEFQYWSGIIIFIVVIFIVFLGLGFSAWQFYITMHQIKIKQALILQDKPVDPGDPAASLKSDIEISTSGIKINSSVLGVIIIALSIAFFYLYLLYVYPIHATEQAKKIDVPAIEKPK